MSELFDEKFFAGLNRLKLMTHIRLDKGMSGSRKSSEKGSSVEFSDFREYLPGDDIRRIDWNVYGRLDKLYVKQFMEEKEAFYHIFVDTSGSMDFGEQKKSVMALRLAAVFTWLVLKQMDRVEILTVKEGRLGKTCPIVGRSSFQRLLQDLEQVSFEGTTGISKAVHQSTINGRGVCILLSDFLDPEGVEDAIRYLVYKRQEILLIQILSKEETDFYGEGTLELEDMETGGKVQVTMTRQTMQMYADAIAAHKQSVEKLARRYGCSYFCIRSDEDMEKVVFQTLKKMWL